MCLFKYLSLFQCDQCAMGFTNSANLGRHQDRYHKSDDQKKVFICTDCGGFFTRKDTLKAHCLSIHGKPMTNFEVKTVAEVGMPSKNSSMSISSLPRERNQGVDTTKSPSADCGGRYECYCIFISFCLLRVSGTINYEKAK